MGGLPNSSNIVAKPDQLTQPSPSTMGAKRFQTRPDISDRYPFARHQDLENSLVRANPSPAGVYDPMADAQIGTLTGTISARGSGHRDRDRRGFRKHRLLLPVIRTGRVVVAPTHPLRERSRSRADLRVAPASTWGIRLA